MASSFDGVPRKKASSRTRVIWRLRLFHHKRTGEVSPTVCCAANIVNHLVFRRGREGLNAHKIMALASDRWVYPAILDEMLTKDTVKPTDWALTSQKHMSLPQVFDRGR
jgi:hypothetical protein